MDNWQDIASCPSFDFYDEKVSCLLWNGEKVCTGYHWLDADEEIDRWICDQQIYYENELIPRPTHWQPFPAEPTPSLGIRAG